MHSKYILWTERILVGEFELPGDEEGLMGDSEPVVDIDEDDSMTTENLVVRV